MKDEYAPSRQRKSFSAKNVGTLNLVSERVTASARAGPLAGTKVHRPTLLANSFTPSTHHFFALVVECRGGFVEEKDRRVVEDGAGDGNTLHGERVNVGGERVSWSGFYAVICFVYTLVLVGPVSYLLGNSQYFVRVKATCGALCLLAPTCFWPPDRRALFSPTSVSYPSAKAMMKLCALAALAASSILSSLALGLPLAMLSRIVPWNSTGSCPT